MHPGLVPMLYLYPIVMKNRNLKIPIEGNVQ